MFKRFVLFLATVLISGATSNVLNHFGRRKYSPLLFFKVPKGTSQECDDMDKVVLEVEKELNIRVQRFDIARDRMARKLYEKIDEIEFVGEIPLLYHRESRQSIYGLDRKSRVKAWAKGRWLSTSGSSIVGSEGKAFSKGFLAEEGEENIEEYDMMDDNLTDLQQLGRDKMLERMEGDK